MQQIHRAQWGINKSLVSAILNFPEAIPRFMMKFFSISSASELLDDNQNTKNFLNNSPLVYLTGPLTMRTLCWPDTDHRIFSFAPQAKGTTGLRLLLPLALMITAYPFPECSSSELCSRTVLVDPRIDWDDWLWRFALQCFGSSHCVL